MYIYLYIKMVILYTFTNLNWDYALKYNQGYSEFRYFSIQDEHYSFHRRTLSFFVIMF